jgi:DNA-binding response OmpR family regulator
MADRFRILVLNASNDTCDMLETFFRAHGWETAAAATAPLRAGTASVEDLIAAHRPDAIVLDVAIPYEENWELAQRLRHHPAVSCPIILTTTNEAVLRRLVGVQEPLYEIVGKPYDLDQLHSAVLRELQHEGERPAPPGVERRQGDRRHGDRRTSLSQEPDAAEDRPARRLRLVR